VESIQVGLVHVMNLSAAFMAVKIVSQFSAKLSISMNNRTSKFANCYNDEL